MQHTTYDIRSRTTFMARADGGRAMFRSLLEARWALTFYKLGITWEYEPYQFDLPNGGKYTPDFYLEGIGWIEIKPTFSALSAVEAKLSDFARWASDIVPVDTVSNVYSITADFPTFRPVCRGYSPVMEWSEEGIKVGDMAFGLHAIITSAAKAFRNEEPGLYEDHVERICSFTSKAYFDGPFTIEEATFMAFQGWSDPEYQLADRKRYYLNS